MWFADKTAITAPLIFSARFAMDDGFDMQCLSVKNRQEPSPYAAANHGNGFDGDERRLPSSMGFIASMNPMDEESRSETKIRSANQDQAVHQAVENQSIFCILNSADGGARRNENLFMLH